MIITKGADIFVIILSEIFIIYLESFGFCQDQQEGTQMQNERNKYLLKHKTLQGGAQGEQSWNYSKQQERTKHPEGRQSGEQSQLVPMKDYLHQAWLADCMGEPTGRKSQVVEQDWREHTAQTRQHAKHVIKGKNNK